MGVTPLDNLKNVLLESLQTIWKEVNKPQGLETSKVEDFFDFGFYALPHKILQPEKFEQEVEVLRERCVFSLFAFYKALIRVTDY